MAETRVTGGELRGRVLKTPPGRRVRPTTSLVRQALFNSIGESIRAARVLDLFAGAGTIGIEALSRGAQRATFVDGEESCATIVRENLAALGLAERATVACAQVIEWLETHETKLSDFNLVMIDPPYRDQPVLEGTLQRLDRANLRPQALVVVEHHRRQPLPFLENMELIKARDYGMTRLSFLRYR
jgi:16S rRNA (guanine966-N2)-methyltransferase